MKNESIEYIDKLIKNIFEGMSIPENFFEKTKIYRRVNINMCKSYRQWKRNEKCFEYAKDRILKSTIEIAKNIEGLTIEQAKKYLIKTKFELVLNDNVIFYFRQKKLNAYLNNESFPKFELLSNKIKIK